MTRQLQAIAILLLVALVGFNFGCKTGAGKAEQGLTSERQVPPFFKNIPVDTPYVMAATEPMPWEVTETFYKKATGFYASLYEELDMSVDDGHDPAERFMLALIEEFTTQMDREGLERLGLSTQARFAVYGVGIFPVVRLELGDVEAFEAMLTRVENRSGFTAEKRNLEGVDYRFYGNKEGAIIVAITEGQVVFSGVAGEVMDLALPVILGTTLPEKSFAHQNPLASLNKEYGFLPFASGFFNIEELVAIAFGASDNALATQIWNGLEMETDRISETCRNEMTKLVGFAPRAVLGYTEFSRERFAMTMGLEVKGDFAERLGATRAPIPAYGAPLVQQAMAMLGVGVDVAKLANFARDMAVEVQASPFRCEEFGWINEMAMQLQFAPDQVPPFLSQVRGFSAIVSSFGSADNEAMKVDAVALMNTSEPETLLGVLQMFVPVFQNVSVEANGVPAALPAELGVPMIDALHVAMTSTTLGFSVGMGMQDTLASLLEQPSTAQTPMFTLTYNYDEIMSRVTGLLGLPMGNLFGPITSMFGNVTMSFDARDGGLFMEYDAEIKP